jgi:hypothetical protein
MFLKQTSAHVAVINDDWMYVFGGWNGHRNQNSMYRLHLGNRLDCEMCC